MSDWKEAAAIKYISGDAAPFLLCKGRRELAERLIRLAEEEGVPLVRNPELLEQLLILEPGSYLPAELFEVVAEILSFVYAQESGRIK